MSKARDETRVAVIVPHRNHTRFLAGLLEQLGSLTRRPDQIVVVDDASDTDERESLQALLKSHPDVQLEQLENWSGPNAAISAGLDLVQADFVALIAADDWIDSTFIARSVEVLEANPLAAFSFCDPAIASNSPEDAQRYSLFLSERARYFEPEAFVSLFRRLPFTFSTNTIVYRREPLVALGGFDPALEWHADWFVAHALALTHGACYLPGHLAIFRQRRDSYSGVALSCRSGRRDVSRLVLSKLRDQVPVAAERLRRAAVLPEYAVRYLPLLFGTPEGRYFLSARVLVRIAVGQVWAAVRPALPHAMRRGLRAALTRTR